MKSYIPTMLAILIGMSSFSGCKPGADNTGRDEEGPPPSTNSRAPTHAASIEEIIAAGQIRPFGPLGPRFELEPAIYERVLVHRSTAIALLEKELGASDVIVRCNAYDFLAHIAKKDSPGSRAYSLLRKGLNDKSDMVRAFVRMLLSGMPAALQRG